MEIRASSENLMLRLLDATTVRQRVIANNIANQSTPGYTRKLVVFEDRLREAMREGDASGFDHARPQVVDDVVTPERSDGNNVTPELEQVADQENRLLYETYLTILQGHYSLLNTAIGRGA